MAGRIRDEVAADGFSLLKLTELEKKLGVSPADMKRAAAYLREQDDLRMHRRRAAVFPADEG
jgi:selenocysteine-specific elongation factor